MPPRDNTITKSLSKPGPSVRGGGTAGKFKTQGCPRECWGIGQPSACCMWGLKASEAEMAMNNQRARPRLAT